MRNVLIILLVAHANTHGIPFSQANIQWEEVLSNMNDIHKEAIICGIKADQFTGYSLFQTVIAFTISEQIHDTENLESGFRQFVIAKLRSIDKDAKFASGLKKKTTICDEEKDKFIELFDIINEICKKVVAECPFIATKETEIQLLFQFLAETKTEDDDYILKTIQEYMFMRLTDFMGDMPLDMGMINDELKAIVNKTKSIWRSEGLCQGINSSINMINEMFKKLCASTNLTVRRNLLETILRASHRVTESGSPRNLEDFLARWTRPADRSSSSS